MFGPGRSHSDHRPAADWRRQAFTFAALVAVFLQAFVVQTHVHAPATMLGAGYEQSSTDTHDVTAHASAADQKTMCALCQVLSNPGTAPPSDAIWLAADRADDAAAVALALAPSAISHFWQSRAPPSFL
jgi:hypothetical protein